MIGAAVAESIANGSSKKQACAEAGVAYSTFMRWQRQKRSLRTLLEEAAQTWRDDKRMECDLKVLLSKKLAEPDVRSHLHDRRPYRDPNAQPVKWMKLISGGWFVGFPSTRSSRLRSRPLRASGLRFLWRRVARPQGRIGLKDFGGSILVAVLEIPENGAALEVPSPFFCSKTASVPF